MFTSSRNNTFNTAGLSSASLDAAVGCVPSVMAATREHA